MCRFLAASVLGLLIGWPDMARAGTIFVTPDNTINPFDSHPIAASADFSISGNTLTLVLTNTNTGAIGKYAPSDGLMAVFFDVAGDPALTYTKASASSLRHGTTVTAGPADITSQWSYASKAAGPPTSGGAKSWGASITWSTGSGAVSGAAG